jgi:hypothetical protein
VALWSEGGTESWRSGDPLLRASWTPRRSPSCRNRRPPWTTSAGRSPAEPPVGGPPPSSSSVAKSRPLLKPAAACAKSTSSRLPRRDFAPPSLTSASPLMYRRGGDLGAVRFRRHRGEPDNVPDRPARAAHGVGSCGHQCLERCRPHAAAARCRRRGLLVGTIPHRNRCLRPLHPGMCALFLLRRLSANGIQLALSH